MRSNLLYETNVFSEISFSQNQSGRPQIKCQSRKDVHYVCINKNCKHECAVMCCDKKCECMKLHDSCFMIDIQNVVKVIETKTVPLKMIKDKVNEIFDDTILQLKTIQNELIESYDQLFSLRLYSDEEKLFLSELRSLEGKRIKGELLSEILNNADNRDQKNTMLKKVTQDIDQAQESLMYQIDILWLKVKQSLFKLQKKQVGLKYDEPPILFNESMIIDNIVDENTLVQFFQDEVNEAKLLYRASQHAFEGEKFHKLCDDVQGVLIIVRMQHGKVIGGYSTVGFPSNSPGFWTEDQSQKSFIFSVTEGDKMTLRDPSQAVANFSTDKEQIFRIGGDLRIFNKANQNQKSKTKLLREYFNEKYPNNSTGYKKFTGSETNHFRIQQWEAWKITKNQ